MGKNHRFKGLKRKELKMLIKQREATITSLTNDVEVLKVRVAKWKEQCKAEEYYKKQAEEKATRQALKVVKLEQENEELRDAYDRSLNALNVSLGRNKTAYIGEMPGSLVMGNNGQLGEERIDMIGSIFGVPTSGKIVATELNTEKPNKDNAGVGHYPFDEEGHVPFDEPTNGVSYKPEELNDGFSGTKVDEAVEWAKRNGHHFPKGKPEKDRMASVVVKSADEISEENRKKAEDTLGFVG